jgi:hypothetical protein
VFSSDPNVKRVVEFVDIFNIFLIVN